MSRLFALPELKLLVGQGFQEALVQPHLALHRAEAAFGQLAPIGYQPLCNCSTPVTTSFEAEASDHGAGRVERLNTPALRRGSSVRM
jgi:hypothetical protein